MAGYATYDPTTSDPKKIASQNRNLIYGQAQGLTAQQQQAQQQNEQARDATNNYLDPIESGLAEGQGGYNADETSQIELTPADEQSIVNNAGISAGVANQASVGAAQRAANAAGGNPAALAAYRARAAQQSGVNAGNAETAARVAAKTAQSAGAQAVGNARLNQQQQGLGYYGNLQSQQNTNAQQDLGLQNQTYGTEVGGLTGSANTAQSASQNPTGFDKTVGAISGVLGALADGTMPAGTDAVVGEDGPEKVVNTDYMADGDFAAPGDGEDMGMDAAPAAVTPDIPTAPAAGGNAPWWQKLGQQQSGGGGQQAQQPGAVNTYRDLGKLAGTGIKKLFLGGNDDRGGDDMYADGGFPQGDNGIFTEPTEVKLGPKDAVVPLSYRATAKIRPSMAALPAARGRQPYGGARA